MTNPINYHSNSIQYTEDDVLNIKRMRAPASAKLQNDILNITQELPQYTDHSDVAKVYNLSAFFETVGLKNAGLKKATFWTGFKPYAATLAAGFAVIALSSTLWLPTQDESFVVGDYSALTSEQLAEEIEWQDIMLLQDELAFAGL